MAGTEGNINTSVAAVVEVGERTTSAMLMSIIDEIAVLIRERDDIDSVMVRVDGDTPPPLRYVVRVLDRQARTYGKTVAFSHEEASNTRRSPAWSRVLS
jgi:hypothetical protein